MPRSNKRKQRQTLQSSLSDVGDDVGDNKSGGGTTSVRRSKRQRDSSPLSATAPTEDASGLDREAERSLGTSTSVSGKLKAAAVAAANSDSEKKRAPSSADVHAPLASNRNSPRRKTTTTTRPRSTDDYVLVQNTVALETLVIKRTVPERRASKKSKHEKWTEVIAPLHMLQDEVRSYLTTNNDGTKAKNGGKQKIEEVQLGFLQKWVSQVTRRLVKRNQRVLVNQEVATELKLVEHQVARLRDQIITTKSDIRRARSENESLEEEVKAQTERNDKCRSASRLLESIDRLCRGPS